MLQVKVFKSYHRQIETEVNEWLTSPEQENYHIFEVTQSTSNDYVCVMVTYDNDRVALLAKEKNEANKLVFPPNQTDTVSQH